MEKPLDDRCNTTKRAATAGDASSAKTAAGIAVYLLEELGDARLRCAQLKKYVSEAQQLVERSTHRDHFFEVAAHLIQGIPDALFKLEKALDAAAMSAARMDYEEIKQNLKPEKVEELETVLQDARVRYLQRRSGGVSNAKQAAAEIRRIADVADATGRVPVEDVMVLLAALERGGRTAGSKVSASERLRELAASVETRTNPSRVEIAKSLRSFLADSVQPTASQSATAVMQQANSREEVMKGFKESNPDLTEEQLKRIADEWEKNKDVVKDKSAATLKSDIESGLKKDEADLAKIKKDIAKLEKGEKVENLTLDGAKSVEHGLTAVIENKKKLLSKMGSHHAEEVESFHAEGAPQDDQDAEKKVALALADAASSLANGGKMLATNKSVALMMLASGVQGLGEALFACGLPTSASSVKYAGELLQNAAKKTLSTP